MLERGIEPHIAGSVGRPVEVPTDNFVKLSVIFVCITPAYRDLSGDLALSSPFVQQITPITEVYGGESVGIAKMQYIHRTFSVGHKKFSFRKIKKIKK
jgi:hypothetical protein